MAQALSVTGRIRVLAVLAVLSGATAYEVLVALGVIGLGTVPGAGPPGGEIALVLAMLALVVGAFTVLWIARSSQRTRLAEFLAPAAAAFLVARFYTFDDYYLPTLRRASDEGLLAPELVWGTAAVALVAGVLVRVRSRIGLALTAPVMLACGLCAWVAYGGH